MYSPVGTVVFEGLVLVENPDDVFIVLVDFQTSVGDIQNFEPFSINGMDNNGVFSSITGDELLSITTDQVLDHIDTDVYYHFQLSVLSTGVRTIVVEASVLLYEIGKLKCLSLVL